MTAPIPAILLALDGKIAFVKATNPWGSPEKEEGELTKDQVAEKIKKTLLGVIPNEHRGRPKQA